MNNGSNQQFIASTKYMLETEEYDTDALEVDILLHEKYGICNIEKLIQNQLNFDLIYDYVYDNKCMLSFI